MIIVKLYGGLGNQLFQYCMGRVLSLRHGTELYLDFSYFEQGKNSHPLSAIHFNLAYQKVSKNEYDIIYKKNMPYLLWKIYNQYQKTLPYYKKTAVLQKFDWFDPNILRVGKNAILNGYWQSPKYFDGFTSVIRNDLQLKQYPENNKFEEIKSILLESISVVINVRRGDYLSLNVPLCTEEYYLKAMDYIEQRVENPVYMIFSDDIEWCREHIRTQRRKIFVERSWNLHDYERMTLMRFAKHHIIANSTFGWWGAWLNPSAEKIVVYPEITNKTLNRDLMPEDWIRL